VRRRSGSVELVRRALSWLVGLAVLIAVIVGIALGFDAIGLPRVLGFVVGLMVALALPTAIARARGQRAPHDSP
jgi:type IV secretory pathway VirB2 component (pilin)